MAARKQKTRAARRDKTRTAPSRKAPTKASGVTGARRRGAARPGTSRARAASPREDRTPSTLPVPAAPRKRSEGGPKTTFELGVDPAKVDEALQTLRTEVSRLVRRGFGDKIRIKYRGKPLGPDIPVAWFLAAEALAISSTGILRVLLVNLGAKALLDVELISSAEEDFAKGMDAYLAGNLDEARAKFAAAIESDDAHAKSHRMLGTVLKVKGELAGARKHLARAAALDPEGDEGKKARELLDALG